MCTRLPRQKLLTRPFRAAWLVLALIAPLTGTAQANLLDHGFQLSYRASFRGLHIGVTKRRLSRNGGDTWLFRSDNEPQGLVKLLVDFDITEESELVMTEAEVRPLRYSYRFEGRDDKSYRLGFDWEAAKLEAQPADLELDLPPGTQDNLSFLVAVMQKLQQGEDRFQVIVAGRNKLRTHSVETLQRQTLETPLGELATVFVAAKEVGRDTRYELWCAPALDYLPVKMRQVKKDKPDIELLLESLSPLGPTAPVKTE